MAATSQRGWNSRDILRKKSPPCVSREKRVAETECRNFYGGKQMVLPHDQLNNRGGNHLEWEAWKSTSPFTHAIPCADGGAFPENSEKNGTDGILASRIPYVQHSSKAYIPKLLQNLYGIRNLIYILLLYSYYHTNEGFCWYSDCYLRIIPWLYMIWYYT